LQPLCQIAFFVQADYRPVRLAYQPPANSTFLSEQTSHQQTARTSQQYSSLRTNQHQPSATSQPNRLYMRDDADGETVARHLETYMLFEYVIFYI
jgi:hypothetical protein